MKPRRAGNDVETEPLTICFGCECARTLLSNRLPSSRLPREKRCEGGARDDTIASFPAILSTSTLPYRAAKICERPGTTLRQFWMQPPRRTFFLLPP